MLQQLKTGGIVVAGVCTPHVIWVERSCTERNIWYAKQSGATDQPCEPLVAACTYCWIGVDHVVSAGNRGNFESARSNRGGEGIGCLQ
ncbi:hypothetical protein SDC9_165640 [bioreactor metagenome]|uniref:Uncharacterized protein n=1 Tax=bioreactor metagenome TaxID=1076179 RepID=A0A645FX98_9ZZZZ